MYNLYYKLFFNTIFKIFILDIFYFLKKIFYLPDIPGNKLSI